MRFLLAARIRDFRSIAGAEVGSFDHLTPIVGPNGSGKSNFLRALNLFFNDAVEPGVAFDLRRDFREPGRKAKLRVAIEVDLDFGAFDAIRADYEESLDRLSEGYRVITFRKEWTLHPVSGDPQVVLSAGPLPDELQPVSPENQPHAVRLLRSIRFRYVPNHVHPSRILESEEDAIRKILFDRLRQKKVLSETVVRQIGSEADELMKPITEAMLQAAIGVGDVELATPTDWREIAWAFGLRLRAGQSRPFDAILHGSGIQSVLAYQVLHMVDTTFSGSFGWRKGAIWAVEEPESFLHARLQSELAKALAAYADSATLQVILTTHSPAFLGLSTTGVVASVGDGGRSAFEVAARRDVIRASYASGTSVWTHPLHTGPPKPLLLVEGQDDRDLLIRAYSQADAFCPFEILCLRDFDEKMTGGDQLAPWLRYHRAAIEARPETSPIVVLLDWEVKDDLVSRVHKELKVHGTSRCVRWPHDLTNSDLSDNWVGIEKFFATRFLEHCERRLGLPLLVPANPAGVPWRYSVDKKKLAEFKSDLHNELAARNKSGDIALLVEALPWISKQVSDMPPLL